MFISELRLYINYLKEQLEAELPSEQLSKKKKYFKTFYQNLKDGMHYYRLLQGVADTGRDQFVKSLDNASIELDLLNAQYSIDNDNVEQD